MQWGEENRVTFGSFLPNTKLMIEKFGNAFCTKMWETIREILLISEVILRKKPGKDGKNDSDDKNLEFRV